MNNLKNTILSLARETVESYILESKTIKFNEKHPYLLDKKAAFVCLKKQGELRGCIGTIEPKYENLATEIINNAIRAATKDYRFDPVEASELPDIEYSVDVLTRPKMITSKEELDPKKYGVIVEDGLNRGLLLPDLEGVDTKEMQIEIAKQKAGIMHDKNIKMYRFEVERF